MGINEQYFSAAMERLEERRRANRLESDMRRSEVESKIPEYRDLSLKLGETGSEIVRLVMRGGDTSKELAEVERRNLEIQKRLAELGYPVGSADGVFGDNTLYDVEMASYDFGKLSFISYVSVRRHRGCLQQFVRDPS